MYRLMGIQDPSSKLVPDYGRWGVVGRGGHLRTPKNADEAMSVMSVIEETEAHDLRSNPFSGDNTLFHTADRSLLFARRCSPKNLTATHCVPQVTDFALQLPTAGSYLRSRTRVDMLGSSSTASIEITDRVNVHVASAGKSCQKGHPMITSIQIREQRGILFTWMPSTTWTWPAKEGWKNNSSFIRNRKEKKECTLTCFQNLIFPARAPAIHSTPP
ncbi:hypothetical protein F5887DRAFT_913478 [Amanita rubescens]|nr:hypothetical protein F5887DRAFT_923009 [Amanita rubescens]KAF8350444.1 hypothetical protein F5887DRAFT_913478 [Amanita rubescens]